jgi:A/G-specific adenine glycosylase
MENLHPDAAWFTAQLLRWFRDHGRDFLWRNTDDPYVVLVCEVLLRRSRSTTVAKVMSGFFERWPDVPALADAEPEDVAAVIRPLGLTSRSVQLVAMARELRDLPSFPRSVDELTDLTGIGRYAAAATLGLPTVDGTSARVYRRFFGLTDDRPHKTVDDELWGAIEAISPNDQNASRRLNWAVLDLAASQCLPEKPRCSACPLVRRCRTAP